MFRFKLWDKFLVKNVGEIIFVHSFMEFSVIDIGMGTIIISNI